MRLQCRKKCLTIQGAGYYQKVGGGKGINSFLKNDEQVMTHSPSESEHELMHFLPTREERTLDSLRGIYYR